MRTLYGAIVEAARNPVLYADFGVPDSVEGRTEAVMLHVGLVVDRLSAGDEAARLAARDLSEVFFADMDQSLREMGVGDLSVPKKMKKIASAFYGRLAALKEALAAGGDALPVTMARNVLGAPVGAEAAALAGYVSAAHAALAATPAEALADGRLSLPDPAGFRPISEES